MGIKLSESASVKFYYLLWAAHFIYSGLQIRYGYPTQPYEATFLRDTSPKYVYLWYAYRSTPFLWEMCVITDWTVTKTCLDLF